MDARAAAGVTTAVGSVVGLAGLTWATLRTQADRATRTIEQAAVRAAVEAGLLDDEHVEGLSPSSVPPPQGDGRWDPAGERPAGDGPAVLELVMVGDSTAVGYGTRDPLDLPGVQLARGVAAGIGGTVRLTTVGWTGASSADLAEQHRRLLARRSGPTLAVVVVGANDITAKVLPHRAAALLGETVRALRAAGVGVVVACCPDFGVIAPIPQPLRTVLAQYSHTLSLLQARASRAAGAVAVPIDRLVSPGFRGHPELFFADGFHPSAAGYRRAVEVLLPACLQVVADGLADEVADGAAGAGTGAPDEVVTG